MAGAGVGTGQDRTVLLSSNQVVNVFALASTLQRCGVSFAGAQAFAQGNPVASASDRKALASMFSDALAQLGNG